MSCTVRVQYVVEAPHLQSYWAPSTKVIDDVVYAKLNKWDRGFVRFTKSKALDFSRLQEHSANVAVLDELCRLRNIACDAAFHSLGTESVDDAPKKTKKYVRKARASDGCFLPSFVEVLLPDIVGRDGNTTSGFQVKVLVEGIRTSNLFIEMTSEVMSYIHTAVINSDTKGRHWRKREEQGSLPKARSRSRSPTQMSDASVESKEP
jgi:hypothetical protein